MAKILRIRFNESDYELLNRLAKSSNMTLSHFIRQTLLKAVKDEIKENRDFSKLIDELNNLSEVRNAVSVLRDIVRGMDEFNKNFLLVNYVLLRNAIAALLNFDKKTSLINTIDAIELERFGKTIYELFGLK